MNENKKSISTILFALALLAFLIATFMMFAPIVSNPNSASAFPSMFKAAFGINCVRVPGLTAIFSLQMIVLVGVLFILVGALTKKLNNILLIVIYCLICLCSFIAFIISFNAKGLYYNLNASGFIGDYSLGVGPILYSIFHIIGLSLSVFGLLISRRK